MKVRNRQCKACPWRVDVVPEEDIPNGYCSKKHAGLKNTIAKPGELESGPMHLMACHEAQRGKEYPCVGWLANQLGPGNNIRLRILALSGQFSKIRTIGPQHETLEDTLPRGDQE